MDANRSDDEAVDDFVGRVDGGVLKEINCVAIISEDYLLDNNQHSLGAFFPMPTSAQMAHSSENHLSAGRFNLGKCDSNHKVYEGKQRSVLMVFCLVSLAGRQMRASH
jgi:hypothetical protein